jgi:hypothetical protein
MEQFQSTPQMPANKDEAITIKTAPHEAAAASGQMPANEDDAMTMKTAPHKAAAASGHSHEKSFHCFAVS